MQVFYNTMQQRNDQWTERLVTKVVDVAVSDRENLGEALEWLRVNRPAAYLVRDLEEVPFPPEELAFWDERIDHLRRMVGPGGLGPDMEATMKAHPQRYLLVLHDILGDLNAAHIGDAPVCPSAFNLVPMPDASNGFVRVRLTFIRSWNACFFASGCHCLI